MRLLFEIDLKDYDKKGKAFIRPSARAIIIKDNKVYMVHSLVYDYYKFPGGGIEKNESNIDALIRETAEEAGLVVIKDSIK
ncbi:MAG: NUDIX domain-containing protein [Acholeplasmatales bacterium]|nr:NUDIX domain-containing protein [Acholeplasmatales bacterium]